jgi:hypothetical protein
MVILDGHEHLTAEEVRLRQDQRHERHWRRWGPYLAERQWGTGEILSRKHLPLILLSTWNLTIAREDYSSDGGASNHFPHDHARSRAYRWGEDGIAGVSDNHGRLNIAFAFWNEKE